jgi:glycerol-3-phosphate dehydrogenase
VEVAASQPYDLIVVGGGIYGACLTLEAARRGMRVLLLERDDFGEHTTWNSLRILHGGLRYLQRFDVGRFRQSVREQMWWRRQFPELVTLLPCLMPLYGSGLRRPGVMRVAGWWNDLLRGQASASIPERTQVISAAATRSLFPDVDRSGLRGGLVWHDGLLTAPQRMLIEVLRWAVACQADVLNYVKALDILEPSGRVAGVRANCRQTQRVMTFRAPCVVNCAGPWAQRLARHFDPRVPDLFTPSLAFNILLDRRPLSTAALAVRPPGRSAPTYFLVPQDDHIMAGTVHAPWGGASVDRVPTDLIARFRHDLNAAIPALKLQACEVLHVYAGVLPARPAGGGRPARRAILHDHQRNGGPRGLFTLCGVKYTTARAAAQRVLAVVFQQRDRRVPDYGTVPRPAAPHGLNLRRFPAAALQQSSGVSNLQALVEEESVMALDDLLFRRTDWCWNPCRAQEVRDAVARALAWPESRAGGGTTGPSAPPVAGRGSKRGPR